VFKNRAYLSGLGLGLIVGALLLQLMFVVAQADQKPDARAPAAPGPADELEPKKLKEAASRYFQVFEKDEKVYTQAEVDKKVREAQAQNGGAAPAADKKIAVYVSKGLIATEVAELLYRSGVVADRNAFEKMLTDQQITNKIQVGYHVFEGNPDMQQVINTLLMPQ
jgi:hypothetical protein